MNATREWPQILNFGTGDTITEELVGQKYREMAKKYHPDAGGSVDDMQQLNAAKQLALTWIAGERKRREDMRRAQQIAAQHMVAAQSAMNNAYTAQFMQQQQFMSQFANAVNMAANVVGTQAQGQAMADVAKAQREAAVKEKRSFLGNFFRRKS